MTKKTEQLIIDYVKNYRHILFNNKPNSKLSYEKQPLTEADREYGIIMRIGVLLTIGTKDNTLVGGCKEKLKAMLYDYCVDTNLNIYIVEPNKNLTNLSLEITALKAKWEAKWLNKTQKEKIRKEKEKLFKIKEIATLIEKKED